MTRTVPRSASSEAPPIPAWHALSIERVASLLSTSVTRGLSQAQALVTLQSIGPNALTATRKVSPWSILARQFRNVLIVILLLATLLSAVLGHQSEAGAIAVIVLFAVLLGFIQEYRAERAIDALRTMAAPTATVLREGEEREIPARDVVPGDLILLAAGDKVPADARLIESISLQADEASLTGESLPAGKTTDPVGATDAPVGDRISMVHAGTVITYGRGRAIVTATGMQTQFGLIAGLLQGVESGPTPLQQNLDHLGKTLGKAALVLVALISIAGFLRGQPALDMLIFAIALAVAVVPEALPAVVTISLAIGVQKMVKRHALVRRLPAVETLGATSVICSDKTGTLTKDQMTVVRIVAGDQTFAVTGPGYAPIGDFLMEGETIAVSPALRELLLAGVLASDAHLLQTEGRWDVRGDPTEGALISAAAKAGLRKNDLDEAHPRIGEIPFTSETKRMTTLHEIEGHAVAYQKGAPEVLLASCVSVATADGERGLAAADRERILDDARAMAGMALRVLALARKNGATLEDAESGLTFLGLVGMIDPPRPEAIAAIQRCRSAGIQVLMITGDHPATATAIARQLALLDEGDVVTGGELEAMDEAALEQRIDRIRVYARVSPAHKLRVVTALQKRGHIVAMTGDGVNDAPALKKADIGIAMGITGTDVTKEAAAMTLTDDNFASIVAAVEEGRGIYGNIKKYLMYLLSSNIGEICVMAGATVLGMPLPLSAVQLLYVNLATDGLPALALAVDPPERDLMRRPPRDPRGTIFTRPVVALMLTGGLWSTAVNLGLFLWTLGAGKSLEEAMTMTFVSLVLIQFFKAYAFRSDRNSILHAPFANRWLNGSIAAELLCLAAILYIPAISRPLGTYPLQPSEWLLIALLAATVVPVLELCKWMVRRGCFGRPRA